jgi:ABC-type multidrug transport system fused ATPase/permease subunit
MNNKDILPASTDRAERPRLIISREEERLVQRAWPFESRYNQTLIEDISIFRQEVIQYFGINDKEQPDATTSLEECLQDLRAKHNIIDVPLEPETNSLLGDSGLLVVTHPDGVEVIRPSQWRRKKKQSLGDGQIIMLFHGLPQRQASVLVLLLRVLKGRTSHLLIIVIVALIAVLISLGPTWLQAYIFNEVVPNGQRYLMIQIAAFLLCIKLTSSGLKLFNQLVGLRLELYLGLNTTALLVHRLLALPLSFFEQYNTGDLQQRVNSAHALRRALQQSFVSVLTALFVVILNIGLVFFKTYSFELCLILIAATAFGPLIDAITASIETYIRLKRLNLAGKLQNAILYPLESIETIRSLGLEQEVSIRFAVIRHQIARLDIQLGLIKTSLRAVTLCLNATVISLLLYLFSSPETLSWIGADSTGSMPSQGLVVLLLSAFSTINGGVRSLSTSILTLVKVIPDTIRFVPILTGETIAPESSQDGRIDLISLTLTRSPSQASSLTTSSDLTILRGETVGILYNNAQAAVTIARTLAGQSDHGNGAHSEWKVLINQSIIEVSEVDLILKANSMLVGKTPVFTAGTVEQFITDYDIKPDKDRLDKSILAAQLDLSLLDSNSILDSGPGAVSHLSMSECLCIQIARSLYSQYPVVLLFGPLDYFAPHSISGLVDYCRSANKVLFVFTTSEALASQCHQTYDARDGDAPT